MSLTVEANGTCAKDKVKRWFPRGEGGEPRTADLIIRTLKGYRSPQIRITLSYPNNAELSTAFASVVTDTLNEETKASLGEAIIVEQIEFREF